MSHPHYQNDKDLTNVNAITIKKTYPKNGHNENDKNYDGVGENDTQNDMETICQKEKSEVQSQKGIICEGEGENEDKGKKKMKETVKVQVYMNLIV
jgi:hypothetical protein